MISADAIVLIVFRAIIMILLFFFSFDHEIRDLPLFAEVFQIVFFFCSDEM